MLETKDQTGFDLAIAVEQLTSDTALDSLDPYRKTMNDVERARCLKSLILNRGRRYAKASFDNFKALTDSAETALSRLRAFADEMPDRLSHGDGGVVLLGPPGTGKDHMLMGLMKAAIIDHGIQLRWMDGLRLFNEIKKAIATNTVDAQLKNLAAVPILAISDPVPPRDELSAYELAVLRDVVEQRYSRAMATWITTNVQTGEDARRLFTAAVLGRLLDGSMEIFCDWKNYRQPVG